MSTIPEHIQKESRRLSAGFGLSKRSLDRMRENIAAALLAAEERGDARERERCAAIVERDEMDHSIRFDPKRHPNLSDWFREKRAAAIRK